MARFRAVLGIVAGVMLMLSSAAHSLLGWKSLGAQLASAQVPPDLFLSLKVAWMFGGMTMLVLGVIVIALFSRRLSGASVSAFPALVTGVAYLLFGAWALLASENPFFFIFVVPGALLVAAAAGREPTYSGRPYPSRDG